MTDDAEDFEAMVRRAFDRLTREDLPRAAAARGWPVRTPAEFERLLLEHLRGGPGNEPGEQAGVSLFDQVLAIEIGERLIAGTLCCVTMNRRLRCAGAGAPKDDGLAALRRLIAAPRRDGGDA